MTFSWLTVSEVDDQGHEIKEVWAIKPLKNIPVKYITYGVVPIGWTQLAPAIPIDLAKWYSIHGGDYYIRVVQLNGEYKCDVLSRSDFYAKK